MAGTMQMGKWREKVTGKHQAPFFCVCVSSCDHLGTLW